MEENKATMGVGGITVGMPENIAKALTNVFPGCQQELVQILEKLDAGCYVDTADIPECHSQVRDMLHSFLLTVLCLPQTPARGLFYRPTHIGCKTTGAPTTLTQQLAMLLVPGSEEGEEERAQGEETTAVAAEAEGPWVGHDASVVEDGCRQPVVIGPSPRPPAPALEVPAVAEEAASDKRRRVIIGPCMPTFEEKQVAAMELDGGQQQQQQLQEGEDFVGPLPSAEMLLEPDNATQAQRFQEVSRVLEAVADVRPPRMHFAVLGLPVGAPAADVRARFRRLSLLVHPDKCLHPRASEAFDATKAAATELEDPGKRAAVDRRLAEEKERDEAMAAYEREREAAQWRRLRNEEMMPGDAEILAGPVAGPTRDEWMTELPPERQAAAAGVPLSQASVTAFSRVERTGRGDTSGWTDTPAQRAERQRQQRLAAAQGGPSSSLPGAVVEWGPAAASSPASASALATATTAQEKELVEQFNAQRGAAKSLVEQHKEKMIKAAKAEEKKRKRTAEGPDSRGAPAPPVEYRPWDRERDLASGPRRAGASMLNVAQQAQQLASRFSRTSRAPPK